MAKRSITRFSRRVKGGVVGQFMRHKQGFLGRQSARRKSGMKITGIHKRRR